MSKLRKWAGVVTRLSLATGYHDWNQGCEEHPYCFTLNRIHQVKAGSLAPTVPLDPTFTDYLNGRDVVVEWVRAQQRVSKVN